jgi:methionine synthase / methylenetetrahydrofolate reductase(NADPH)
MGLDSPFLDMLTRRVLVADGGMGTLLHERGISFETCFDSLCLDNPDIVLSIHRDYIDAGVDLIETNSFGANAIRLKRFGLESKTRLINREAARVARSAREEMGRDILIAGSIGPTGRRMIQIDHPMYDEIFAAFGEQVDGLLEGGVDLIILETFTDLSEIRIAVDAVRSRCHLPVVAQMTFSYDALTAIGISPATVAESLDKLDVDMIGANCSVGPQPLIDVIQQMGEKTTKPLSVMPNAGLPRYVDGRYLYYTSPEYFGACGLEFVKRGVRLIGGCCGTTPEHIRKLAEVVRSGDAAKPRAKYQPLYFVSLPDEGVVKPTVRKSDFREKLGKELVLSVEIDPPRGSNPEKILKGAEYLAGLGVDAINIADSPMGRARMGAMAAAALVRKATGIEVIMHLTCRDHNLMGLQATILGAHALGISNILAVTGDPPSGDYPNVTAVYDVDSIGLLQIIEALNKGFGLTGTAIGYPTDILAGAAVNPTADDMAMELERLRRKIDYGARYFMTQPIFDIEALKRFRDKTAALDLTVIMGILPLHSLRHALFLHNEVPGIEVPKSIMTRLEKGGDDAHKVGIDIAAELSLAGQSLAAGLYYMPSFGRFETIGAVLDRMGLTNASKTI